MFIREGSALRPYPLPYLINHVIPYKRFHGCKFREKIILTAPLPYTALSKSQVAQAHYERSAYINLFHFAYIMTSAKYKGLYEKCNK